MNAFFKYITGSSTLRVNTPFPARKIGELMSAFPDCIYDAVVVDNYSFEFTCPAYAKRRILKSEIINKEDIVQCTDCGLPHLLFKYKKRYGLIVGIVAIALVLYLQGFVVWEVRISGNNNVSDDEIKETLSLVGFSEGSFILPSQLSELQNKFILKNSKISWISINMSGTVAFVEVKERDIKEDLSENPSMSGIIASKDCIIELSEVTCGTSLVRSGDTVQKGQMIISPLAIGKDGNEYIVGAYGKVLARTSEDFSVTVPYYSQSASFTGRKKAAYTFSFLGKSFSLSMPSLKKFDKYVCTEKSEKIKLFEGAVLPIEVTTKEKLEYYLCEEIITPDDARKKAYSKVYSKISSELPEAEILSVSFAEVEENDCFVLQCRVECIRDVAMRIDGE